MHARGHRTAPVISDSGVLGLGSAEPCDSRADPESLPVLPSSEITGARASVTEASGRWAPPHSGGWLSARRIAPSGLSARGLPTVRGDAHPHLELISSKATAVLTCLWSGVKELRPLP